MLYFSFMPGLSLVKTHHKLHLTRVMSQTGAHHLLLEKKTHHQHPQPIELTPTQVHHLVLESKPHQHHHQRMKMKLSKIHHLVLRLMKANQQIQSWKLPHRHMILSSRRELPESILQLISSVIDSEKWKKLDLRGGCGEKSPTSHGSSKGKYVHTADALAARGE